MKTDFNEIEDIEIEEEPKSAKEIMEAHRTSLFDGDSEYEEQEKQSQRFAMISETSKFLGYGLLNSCSNCVYQSDSECHVMEKFNSDIVFPVVILGKCKHFKKDTSKGTK